jgi:hypothetical protein
MPVTDSERPGVSLAGRPEYNRAITARCFPAAQRFWVAVFASIPPWPGAAELGVGRFALEALELGAKALHQQIHARIASHGQILALAADDGRVFGDLVADIQLSSRC